MKGFGQKDKFQIKKIIKSNNKLSKEETIQRALKLHSKGKIKEAAIYYQYFINQGFQDGNVFSNYGVILRRLKKFESGKITHLYCSFCNGRIINLYNIFFLKICEIF